MNLTTRGARRAPTPNIPWENDTQELALPPATSIKQKLLIDTMTKEAPPIDKKVNIYPKVDSQRMNMLIMRAV